nr:PepSY-associated TM helix domain-containing protein [Pedobacter sp. ASV19]
MSHSSFKNTIRLLHLWLGLISGLVVFVLGLTGSIYAFSDELKELCYKQRLYVDKVPQTPRLQMAYCHSEKLFLICLRTGLI